MQKQTELQDSARDWINSLPRGTEFKLNELYEFLEDNFPQEITARGYAATEPRYKNDARWAVQIAVRDRLVTAQARGVYRWV